MYNIESELLKVNNNVVAVNKILKKSINTNEENALKQKKTPYYVRSYKSG